MVGADKAEEYMKKKKPIAEGFVFTKTDEVTNAIIDQNVLKLLPHFQKAFEEDAWLEVTNLSM